MKKLVFLCGLALLPILWACGQSLQRGMIDGAYISTARPAIMVEVRDMPLITAGEGSANVFWTGMLGGLPVQMWLALYGTGGLAPLAIVTQAQLPGDWYWDSWMRRPFSVAEGTAAFGGTTYDSYTYIVDPKSDPFANFMSATGPEGKPQRWIARVFAARYNFDHDKILLEYREPLPAAIVDLTALPLGYDSYLREFAARAQAAFVVSPCPKNLPSVQKGYIKGVEWQYVNQNFLGSISRNDYLNRQ